MGWTPRFLTAGDRVVVAEYGQEIDVEINAHVHVVARALLEAGLPGLEDVVPTYRSVAVHFDPWRVDRASIVETIRLIDSSRAGHETLPDRVVDIPVVYGGDDGPDLGDVAAHAGLAEDEVVAMHAGGRYRVFMMGFTPGFPYLGGLSTRIAAPRLATPRTLVPAGSVGIAGNQTGIYPSASPGGWRLIGRTPLRLFDPTRTPPTFVEAGDVLRFVPVSRAEFTVLQAQADTQVLPSPTLAGVASEAWFDVVEPGLLTLIQDLGRRGFQRHGVPVSGAMDVCSLRAANRLVRNTDGEAALEITIVGPRLVFGADTAIGLAGADLQPLLNGEPVGTGTTIIVHRGDVLSFGGRRVGARTYLAVRGGIAVPEVLGSRSTYQPALLGGSGGRALRAGDRVPVCVVREFVIPIRRVGVTQLVPSAGREHTIRVLPGPQDDAFAPVGIETFFSATFTISMQSDRTGCRLDGPRIEHRHGPDIVSDGTAFGSIQVTGDGLPIILMADRGTTGGYTKIATVISADLRILAQAMPGDRLRFEAVGEGDALQAQRGDEAMLDAIGDSDDGVEPQAGKAGQDLEAPATGRRVSPADGGTVRAGMGGLVVGVMVEAGVAVAEGDTLVVIEFMKMHNPVRAPRAGTIARVHVTEGSDVAAETTVVEYED